MKKYFHFTTVVLIILALLLSTFPVSAGDIKIKVTGTFYWLGEPSEDPRFRGWDTPPLDPTINHFRFDFQEFYYETDDPRLNGPGLGLTQGEYHWNADGSLAFAHLWGKGTIYADSAKTVPVWDCMYNGHMGSDWVLVFDQVCHGVGANTGLLAKFTLTYPNPDWNYYLEGVIIDPSGK